MPSDTEKRKQKRKQYLIETTLEFSSGNYQARISDISLDGCYVDSIVNVAVDEPVSFTIAASDGSQKFTGEIAYVLPGFGFGIRFTELTEDKIAFLHNVIE